MLNPSECVGAIAKCLSLLDRNVHKNSKNLRVLHLTVKMQEHDFYKNKNWTERDMCALWLTARGNF